MIIEYRSKLTFRVSREHSIASSLCGQEVFLLDPWPQQTVQDKNRMAQVWQGKASFYYIVLIFEAYFLWVNWVIAGFPFKLRMGHFLWKQAFHQGPKLSSPMRMEGQGKLGCFQWVGSDLTVLPWVHSWGPWSVSASLEGTENIEYVTKKEKERRGRERVERRKKRC